PALSPAPGRLRPHTDTSRGSSPSRLQGSRSSVRRPGPPGPGAISEFVPREITPLPDDVDTRLPNFVSSPILNPLHGARLERHSGFHICHLFVPCTCRCLS